MSKKGYLDCEYAQTHVIQSFLDLIQFLFSWFINKKDKGMHLLWALSTHPPLVGIQGQKQIKVDMMFNVFREGTIYWINDLLTRRMPHLYLHHTQDINQQCNDQDQKENGQINHQMKPWIQWRKGVTWVIFTYSKTPYGNP